MDNTSDEWNRRVAKAQKRRFRLEQRPRSLEQLQYRHLTYKYGLQTRPTKAEEAFGRLLTWLKIPFMFQKGFFKPFHRIVDFYIPGKKIIFEIDGPTHANADTARKDRVKDELWLKYRKLTTYRISNEDVLNGNVMEVLRKVFPKSVRRWEVLNS